MQTIPNSPKRAIHPSRLLHSRIERKIGEERNREAIGKDCASRSVNQNKMCQWWKETLEQSGLELDLPGRVKQHRGLDLPRADKHQSP